MCVSRGRMKKITRSLWEKRDVVIYAAGFIHYWGKKMIIIVDTNALMNNCKIDGLLCHKMCS